MCMFCSETQPPWKVNVNRQGGCVSLQNMHSKYQQQGGEPPHVQEMCCSALQQKGVPIGAQDMSRQQQERAAPALLCT